MKVPTDCFPLGTAISHRILKWAGLSQFPGRCSLYIYFRAFSCAVSVQIASFFGEHTLVVIVVSLSSAPKLSSSSVLQQGRGESSKCSSQMQPELTLWSTRDTICPKISNGLTRKLAHSSQAGCIGKTRAQIVVLQAAPKTSLED